MNILFVCEIDYLRKPVLDTHLLAEAMSLRGHNVYAIDYESLWERNSNSPKEIDVSRVLPDASVHLIRPGFIRIPMISRASAFLTHYFEIGRVIKEKGIDAIMLYSVPTNGLQTVHWAKRLGIPVIFRSIDILNQLVVYPALRPVTKFLERRVYSKVDMVLTITPKLSEYVVGLGANPDKVEVLPMPVDTDLFQPSSDVDAIRQKWGLGKSDQIILFIGTLYGFSGLDIFIRQFSRIIGQAPRVKLLIVGDGSQRYELEGIIAELGLRGRVIITGFQPYQAMPDYINLADVCINPFVATDATRDIFPGKTVQFLACGKVLVATALPGMKAVISGEKQGVIYVDKASEVVEKSLWLLKRPKYRREVGNNGLDYARRVHGHEKIAQQLETILQEVIEGKRNERVAL